MPGRQNPLDRVGQSLLAMRNRNIGQESLKPVQFWSRQSVQPITRRGKDAVDVVNVLDAARFLDLLGAVRDVVAVEEGRIDGRRVGSEVVDRGDLGFVTSVVLVEELLGESGFDTSEELFDGLLSFRAVLDGDGTLEDTGSLRILVEDGFDIVALPEGILRGEGTITSAPQGYKSFKRSRCTFLNQMLKEASRTGMKGTG